MDKYQPPPLAASDLARGQQMHALIAELYPICRSITGDGVRQTLRRIQTEIPLIMHEVPSGSAVLDWIVPDEWNVQSATLRSPAGELLADLDQHNLSLLNYSAPFSGLLTREELEPHLFSLPDQPDLIPYRTSYYKRTWGFSLPHRVRERLAAGSYHAVIDATLAPGSLTYGELLIPGRSSEELLLSCHVCHPSLANDNLSSLAVCTQLAKELLDGSRSISIRMLFVPGTIGSITWLARNRERLASIRYGLVLANLGDRGSFHYKQSRRADADIDWLIPHLADQLTVPVIRRAFSPYGYDERQYCSPGFDLPVGLLSRSVHGSFPEYHTSADNLDFVTPESLAGSLSFLTKLVDLIERDRRFRSTAPFGEPQLGRRGLYRSIGGPGAARLEMAMLWLLNQSDGSHSLTAIAQKSGLTVDLLNEAADLLRSQGLLQTDESAEAS